VRALALATVLVSAPAALGAEPPLPGPYQQALRLLQTDPAARARAQAAVALGQGFTTVPRPGADPRLVGALSESVRRDPDPTVRALAAYALCLLGEARGAPPLIEVLRVHTQAGKDRQEYFDEWGMVPLAYLYRALGFVGGPEARGFLLSMVAGGDREARVLAIGTLGEYWTTDADVDARLETLLREDGDPAIRAAATWALDERRRTRAAPPR
jgi:HEAT repeat protein